MPIGIDNQVNNHCEFLPLASDTTTPDPAPSGPLLDEGLARVYPIDAQPTASHDRKNGAVMDQPRKQPSGRTPPLSRRKLVAGVGSAAALLATSAVACNTSRTPLAGPASGGSQTGKTPKRGGVVNYAGGQGLGSQDIGGRPIDPNTQTQGGAKSFALFYERLVAYNIQTYEVEPELAQKWEQPSPTEYVFTLQPSVKWQNKEPVNGRPMTADDILWSLQRAQTNDPKFLSRSLLSQVDTIQAPSPSTIRTGAGHAEGSGREVPQPGDRRRHRGNWAVRCEIARGQRRR
jgi:hypothetical protein